MVNISTKVKKLNILQKIRLRHALKQAQNPNYTLEKYQKNPDYIRSYPAMLSIITKHENINIEDVRKSVSAELLCSVKKDYDFIKGYSADELNSIINKNIISPYLYQEKDRYELLERLIVEGFPQTLKHDNWGYMPKVEEIIYNKLMQDNKKNAAYSMLTYFTNQNLSRYVDNDPNLIQYLNDDQQKEYKVKLENNIKKLTTTENQLAYISTRPLVFKYLRNESKPEVLRLGFKNGVDMWSAVSNNSEDITLYQNEIEKLLINGSEETIKKIAKFMPVSIVEKIMQKEQFFDKRNLILDNLTEKQLADFFNSQKELIPSYEKEYDLGRILFEHDKYNTIDVLSEENRGFLIQKFQSLSIEEQINYVRNNIYLLKYIPPEEQAKFINGKLENIKYCSLEGKKIHIKNNPNDFLEIDDKSKIQLTAEDIRLFDYLPLYLQYKIKTNLDVPEHAKIYAKFLKNDINASKNFDYENSKTFNGIDYTLKELFNDSQNMDDETAIKYILKSKLFGAIGKLTSANDILHGITADEEINGIDEYANGQLHTIQNLNLSTVEILISIDTNYILPYLASLNGHITKMSPEDRKSSEKRAKDLFTALYGEKKYDEYKDCFKTIYDLEEEYTKKDIKANYQMGALDMVHDFEAYNYHMNVPLEEFKILFNPKIMEKCDPTVIKEYYQALANHEETKLAFEKIIKDAYGEKAVNIVRSRPQLNVHTINSLECLDERILDTYGEAFVHDTISYNIRNFSEFLDVIKDPEKSTLFKSYYDILSGTLGSNVETMQKAITEFSYTSELLENIKDVDLTEDQVVNLVNTLCSERNPYEIKTLEDLNKYNEIANKELQELTLPTNELTLSSLKERICQNLFGIHFYENSSRGYGTSLAKITNLYDITEGETSKGEYSSEEKKLLNILNYINEEKDKDKFKSFISNLGQTSNLRNYTSIAKLVDKIQEKELSQMNSHITSIEKLDKLCKEQANMVNPSVYKEEIDGVPIYHLNGEPFCLFSHSPGKTSIEDILTFEGQGR